MTIEIAKEASKAAIASIQVYFSENMEEAIGGLEAGALLGFIDLYAVPAGVRPKRSLGRHAAYGSSALPSRHLDLSTKVGAIHSPHASFVPWLLHERRDWSQYWGI